MTTQVLATPVSDIVLVVVSPAWSLDQVTIASGFTVEPGSVLSFISGKYVPLNTEYPAVAVAYQKVDATAGDRPGVVLARGGCVDVNGLVWPAETSDEVKADALVQLHSLGIVARTAL